LSQMGLPALSSALLLLAISSSLANPIPLERTAAWLGSDDVGVLEANVPSTTTVTPLVSEKLTCDDTEADRCLLFPIGCVPAVNCSDRLVIRRVHSGANVGDIIVSLNLHVSRTAHMLVAVPMPDVSNPNSTFLVGCAIDEHVAVVARPDVDGVTEQLQMPWLRLVHVRASADDLECVVAAVSGNVDLPVGDVAVFAGDLTEEVPPVVQSHRIAGSLNEEERSPVEEREEKEEKPEVMPSVVMESRIQKVQVHSAVTHKEEHPVPALEDTDEHSAPILTSVEDHSPTATSQSPPSSSTVVISAKATKLRLKPLHSAEGSSAEQRPHQHEEERRHSSPSSTHTPHAPTHHHHTTTTTTVAPTTVVSTTTTEEQEGEETPSTTLAALKVEEGDEEKSTTVSLPHHEQHRNQHEEKHHHSHERAPIDSSHHSVRLPPPVSTTTEKSKQKHFEDDDEIPEEDKKLLRAIEAGRMSPERKEGDEEDEEEGTSRHHHHAAGDSHAPHATTYELSREAAQDPIGKRPSEHSHHHHYHDERHRAANEDTDGKLKKKEKSRGDENEEEEAEERLHSDDERRERMGEKKHQRREREEEEEEEDDDDSSSALSLIVPLIVCLAPVLMG
ncbi:hypothetical protein PFISCL1PPCAC_7607, partial [Pristionchus fissidentatus]